MRKGRNERTILGLALAVGVGMLGNINVASAQCQTYSLTNGPAAYVAGTTDIGNHDDEAMTSVSLPFPVSLYGTSYTDVNVSSNGFIEFGGTRQSFSSPCLPTTIFDGPVIFARMEDLDTSYSGGGVFTSLSGASGSQTFVIEWRHVHAYDGTGVNDLNFEVVFYENQPFFDIIHQPTADQNNVATVGVQGSSTGPATQYQCPSQSNALSGGLSLRFSCDTLANAGSCCYGPDLCVIVSQGSCSSQYFTLGGVCTPNPCPPAPANDLCDGAFNLNNVALPYHVVEDWTTATPDFLFITPDFVLEYASSVWFTFTAPGPGSLVYSDAHPGDSNSSAGVYFALAGACDGTVIDGHFLDYPVDSPPQPLQYAFTSAGQSVNILVTRGILLDYNDPVLSPFPYDLTFNFVPACSADFDGNNTVNVSDIFAFLRAWFAHSASADIDGNGTVNVSDIFAFLRHWFAHC